MLSKEGFPVKDEKYWEEFSRYLYDYLLDHFKKFYKLELTMAEAVHLRNVIKKVIDEKKQGTLEAGSYETEVITRFFREYFGVDIVSYFSNANKDQKEREKRARQLGEYIKKTVRPEMEMI